MVDLRELIHEKTNKDSIAPLEQSMTWRPFIWEILPHLWILEIKKVKEGIHTI
jgi:hypothetical protein